MDRYNIISKMDSNLRTTSSFFSQNKAISPVVATALLLVVAVVAVVGFQSWFGTYSSGVFSDIETQSNSALEWELKIDRLIGDTLYVLNNFQDNLSITELKIGENLCTITDNLTLGMNEVPVSSCAQNLTTSTPDIVLITEKNVVSKKVYVDTQTTSTSSSLDCSSLNGGEWIEVPARAPFTTEPFCVMKYEAKDVGGVPTSQAANTPWVSITQTSAKIECESLGAGYHLITNAEWMSIARNIEQQDSNWVNSTGGVTSVGVGSLKQGNVGSGIAGASYNGADPEQSSDHAGNNLGSFVLSNGEIIWDLSGNVWEWNNDTLDMHPDFIDGVDTDGYWDTQTNATFRLNAGPSNSAWGQSEGVGYVRDSNVMTKAFLRSGYWNDGAYAGAFALYLGYGPSGSGASLGFRCSYAP